MNKSFVLAFAFAVFMLSACQGNKAPKDQSNGSKDSGAKIEFNTLTYDLGTVDKDTVVNKIFIYHNTGTGKLTIEHATAHCGCTIVAFMKEPTAPGDSASLTIALNTEALKTGYFNKQVDIYSNGSEEPITLSIRGELTRKPF
jgi:hypothetical protein